MTEIFWNSYIYCRHNSVGNNEPHLVHLKTHDPKRVALDKIGLVYDWLTDMATCPRFETTLYFSSNATLLHIHVE